MRKTFFYLILKEMEINKNIIIISGDMGYGLLDPIRDTYPDRLINVYSAEQFMIGCAAGLAMEGKIPVCYSITSFLLYYPFGLIRNFMNHEKLPIKLVGGGRDKDYGYLGFTHHMEDDLDILSTLPNIKRWKPETEETLPLIIHEFLYNSQPSYINLKK